MLSFFRDFMSPTRTNVPKGSMVGKMTTKKRKVLFLKDLALSLAAFHGDVMCLLFVHLKYFIIAHEYVNGAEWIGKVHKFNTRSLFSCILLKVCACWKEILVKNKRDEHYWKHVKWLLKFKTRKFTWKKCHT